MLLVQFMPEMEKSITFSAFAGLILISILISQSEQLQSSQGQTLLRIQRILNFPAILSGWNSSTDLCKTEPNSSVTVVCYEESITQLHIVGEKGVPMLPRNFSMDSFVTTLVRLQNLKVLTLVSLGLWGPMPGKISRFSSIEIVNMSSNFLYGGIPQEISSLSSLQTLILDDNMFSGRLPGWLGSLAALTVLSLRQNMFNGSLPDSYSNLENLRVLALSHNYLYGEVPDFSGLTNLQVLDLEDNDFGPKFPQLDNKLLTLVLSDNKFRSGLPAEMSSFYQLQRLDLSNNKFIGPFQTSLLSLPSITYLNISENKLTGMLFRNLSCNAALESVDLSSNLLTGNLPSCLLLRSEKRVVEYSRNCLATSDQNQNPLSFCRNEALAAGILPPRNKQKGASKVVIACGIIGGIFGGIALVGIIFLVIRRLGTRKIIKKPVTRFISENASNSYIPKLVSDARYISHSVKVGALGVPGYRTFSLEELEEATENFDTSAFMGDGSQGQMYRGRLKDGSFVAIRCLKMKKSHSTQNFMYHIELISKLRHQHLVSAIGHCFECYYDDSSVSRIFLVFEYVPNGTLRTWLSGERVRQPLTWAQRIAAAIGVAKGIQFLHTGIVPGIYSNNLKITDILLDHNLVAKISSYNLPLLAQNAGKVDQGASSSASKDAYNSTREKHEDKVDVYDFGVILLEIIVGKPVNSRNEVDALKDLLQASITADKATRRSIIDPAVQRGCLDQSLKTTMEICVRCLLKNPADRPSVEDLLWNLQFAAQVADPLSNEGSPISPSQPPHLQLAFR